MSVEAIIEKLGVTEILKKKDVLEVLMKVMEVVEDYEEAKTGKEKKELAIKVMRELIEKSKADADTKEILMTLLDDETVDTVIDLVSKAAKGELKINKKAIKKGIKSCLLSCMKKQN